jgi:hypothetical protein
VSLGEKHFKRASGNPGAVLCTDANGLEAYRRQKRRFSTINSLERENQDLRARLDRLEAIVLKGTEDK